MSKIAIPKNLDGWYTKQAAAAYLGLAEKTIDRLAESGKVQKAKRKRPGLPAIAVFHPEDLARVKSARDQEAAAAATPFVVPATNGSGREIQTQQPQTSAGAFLTALAAAIAERPTSTLQVPIAQRVFLNLREAAAYSGLEQRDLRQAIADRQLNVWRTCRGGIRIRRVDLEELGHGGRVSDIPEKKAARA